MKKTKKPKCQHNFKLKRFLEPITNTNWWMYEVEDECLRCGETNLRQAEEYEFEEERKKYLCPTCGHLYCDHPDKPFGVNDLRSCVQLLSERLREMESRLTNARVSFLSPR